MQVHRQSRIRGNLERRAIILQALRDFFAQQGFLEVETPVRIPAPLPEVHIDAEPSGDWYLQTSPELCMKRLLAAGYEKIFQISRCFRKAERGARHLPEITLLEWYGLNFDYVDLMGQCEALIGHVAHCLSVRELVYQGHRIDLTPPWERLRVSEAFEQFSAVSVERALRENCFDEIMGLHIEPRLGCERPLFLYDYPVQCAALARRKANDPSLAERFELYVAGLELCNAFSELNDPVEQRSRFEQENRMRRAAGKSVYPMADGFLDALYHLPAAAGNALGIDRLVMLFTDAHCIDEVVAFTPEELD